MSSPSAPLGDRPKAAMARRLETSCQWRRVTASYLPFSSRPIRGTCGVYRVNMRHGVSGVRIGRRHPHGTIFHDADQAICDW